MYDVVWDEETGGILLTNKEKEGPSPEIRPVFLEEIKLLGLDKYFAVPETEAPLLWATPGHVYYYHGQKIAEVSKAGFFRKPRIHLYQKGLALYPVNVSLMLQKNESFLIDLSYQALDFISETYKKYQKRADIFCVSFSGGKDSWVLLDLAQRCLSPQDFVVVFNDTDMEISATYDSLAQAKEHFSKLRFFTAKSHLPAVKTWREFGPPSRLQRWCCVVHKSAPTYLLLKRLVSKKAPQVLLFEGVRAAESSRRASYPQIAPGAKHALQTNASPLFSWSSAEVFLYLFWRRLPLHKGYRFGLGRVGCAVCPLASSWSGFVLWKAFYEDCATFLKILEEYAYASGKTTPEEVREFISSCAWGARAGGWFLKKARAINIENTKGLKICLPREKEDSFKAWLKIAGKLWQTKPNRIFFENQAEKVSLALDYSSQNLTVKISDALAPKTKTIIRAAAYKAAFCIGCRACEAECPHGALSFDAQGGLLWQESLCRKCLRCFTFEERGCLMAKSLQKTSGNQKQTLHGYQTFGLRQEWLSEYFSKGDAFWEENSLGNRQVEALRAWLRDTGLLEKGKLTPLGQFLRPLGAEKALTWEIILVKLACGSRIVRWFLEEISWGEKLSAAELVTRLGEDIVERTRKNAVSALLGLFEHTPLREIAPVERKRTRVIHKKGSDEVSLHGLLFALAHLAERTGRYHFEVEDLMALRPETPYGIFGLSRRRLCALLRAASTEMPDLIQVDLVRDLESVYLQENLNTAKILAILEQRCF